MAKIDRRFVGTVISDKMRKTIIVKVDRKKMYPKYGKYFIVSKKYHVHCEDQNVKKGDKVIFKECRPLSKTKRWTFLQNEETEKHRNKETRE